MSFQDPPAQPPESRWTFIEDLNSPVYRSKKLSCKHLPAPKKNADLSNGVKIECSFPDPEKLLLTAYNDLENFFKSSGVELDGEYKIIFRKGDFEKTETFRISAQADKCEITGSDTEGIRRAVFALEDEIRKNNSPLLKIQDIQKSAYISSRISRCFFGPIKRPPKDIDELANDVDYYPEEYLNKLAHDGVNALWLTVEFKDLCKTSITPENGVDAEKRFKKLNQTIEKCRRYGIKTYIFCIEPIAFDPDSPVLKRYPELGGASIGERKLFCPFSDTAEKYLEEATGVIFEKCPNLGGLINISYGERPTTCFSGEYKTCPRCKNKEPYEIISKTLSAMENGIHRHSKAAELIAWLYVPENSIGVKLPGENDILEDICKNAPEGVIMQYNFESGGLKEQLGKKRKASDYWLSYTGPSRIFEHLAKTSKENNKPFSAKIQVGCSHEIATIPYIPVPSSLFHKYREMHKLGISAVMQCWYFGNYPSIMNRAATSLSFEPFPESEDAFLTSLAAPQWGEYAGEVAKAWKVLFKAYSNYPVNCFFQYYGPMHEGIVWPLHLKPVDKPLAPTWLLGFPPSGDRIGECVTYTHTHTEVVKLTENMQKLWQQGFEIIKKLKPNFTDDAEVLKEINLVEAIGIQFTSGYNILKFYHLREELIFNRKIAHNQKLEILSEMESIVKEEIKNGEKLIELAKNDSRLGFHSEAEGYKYFPEKIEWRINELKNLLEDDFKEVRDNISEIDKMFEEYTGFNDKNAYTAGFVENSAELFADADSPVWQKYPEININGEVATLSGTPDKDKFTIAENRKTTCRVAYDNDAMYFAFKCIEPDMTRIECSREDKILGNEFWFDDGVEVLLEPRRLWPGIRFFVNAKGARGMLVAGNKYEGRWDWKAETLKGENYWSAIIKIPFDWFGENVSPERPVRINCSRIIPVIENGNRDAIFVRQIKHNSLESNRLGLGKYNPEDYLRVVFK